MTDEYIRLEIRVARNIVEDLTFEDLAEAIGIRAANTAKNIIDPDRNMDLEGYIQSLRHTDTNGESTEADDGVGEGPS